MTATTVQNTRVSGLIANPQTIIGRGLHATPELVIKVSQLVATTSIDEVADVVLFTELPWNAIVHEILVFNDDLDAHATPTLAVDIGLFKMTKDGTVTTLDADAYASAVTTLQAANKVGVNVCFESTVKDIDGTDLVKKVFEDAGLTAEPQDGFAILGMKVTTEAATAAAGDVAIIVKYTM
jgi:hypothetical protein